ncbi:UNVERIFIED_CONTAM: hypothetical protein HDU68_007701 [Siphonaria sp. JEL0065]|nr:hypothetical protein HDU68_007701 [Siphonaria sp. JEL0065]
MQPSTLVTVISLFALLVAAINIPKFRVFYIHNPANKKNYCLNNQGYVDKDANPVIGWSCNIEKPGSNDIWYWDHGRLRNSKTNKCLHRSQDRNGNAIPVDIYTCSDNLPSQQWIKTEIDGGVQIMTGDSEIGYFCLNFQLAGFNATADSESVHGYAPIILWQCGIEWNSVWKTREFSNNFF